MIRVIFDRASLFCAFNLVIIFEIAEDEEAFDVLYCTAFEMVDAQWLAMRASYMEFNVRIPMFMFRINFSNSLCYPEKPYHFRVEKALNTLLGIITFILLQKVLQATSSLLERELCSDNVRRIQDLSAYSLLYQ